MDLLFNSSNIVNFMLKSDGGETEGQICCICSLECNLTKRRTLQPVFSEESFENGWLRTAASEQSEISAFDVIQFFTIKISFGILL